MIGPMLFLTYKTDMPVWLNDNGSVYRLLEVMQISTNMYLATVLISIRNSALRNGSKIIIIIN